MSELVSVGCILLAVIGLLTPVPPAVLDVFVVFNLLFAILSLILSVTVKDVLQLSSFPAILLTNTLFRICLSVAVTRSILGQAEAGEVIKLFGETLVGQNIFLGLVVYVIITTVQFFVIAKGAERVAEVSARFSLDSLPGRQMSIDADVRMGVIDPETAKQKRLELQNESRFFGALDGTMKFVKGDALAGVLIVLINLLGGLAVGTLISDLTFQEAIATYVTLSIGEGLVSQIPSFLNGLSAGFLVSRVERESERGLAKLMIDQISQHPQSKLALGGICLAIVLFTPLPPFIFLLAGSLLFLSAFAKGMAAKFDKKPFFKFDPRLENLITVEINLPIDDFMQFPELLKQRIFDTYSIPVWRVSVQQNLSCFKLYVRDNLIFSRENPSSREEALSSIVEALKNWLPELFDERSVYYLHNLYEKQCGIANTEQPLNVFKIKEILQELVKQGLTLKPLDVVLGTVFNLDNSFSVEEGVYEVRKRLFKYSLKDSSELRLIMLDHDDALNIEECLLQGSILPFDIVKRLKESLPDEENIFLVTFKNTATYLRKALGLTKTKILSTEELPDKMNVTNIEIFRLGTENVAAIG
ncbi:MAG: flagellar biosynthesis protein FlhA [Deltaproteobacteria bacterium]|nr:flagellar biosynthesis protein FlhA [Deltaproteobacteria bacterium]